VHPDQTDGCNGVDDDCDLDFDEDGGATIPYYWDGDSDGYGTYAKAIESCGDVPEGFVAMMHAPATGKILSDLILHGNTGILSDVSVLGFDRFAKGALLHETAIL